MAVLTKDREASSAEHPVAPEGTCPTCGASLTREQDWCLECGTAAPGRIGGHPAGWRSAATLIAVTLLLVSGAVVASYAALTGDAQRDADQPPIAANADPAQPDQPVPPIAPAAPTGPGTDPEAVAPAQPPPEPAEPEAPAPAPSTPAPAAPAPAPEQPSQPPPPQAVDIPLAKAGGSSYDPYDRPGAELGRAANALDGSRRTVWDVVVPADNESIRVGLVVSLGGPTDVRSITVSSPTPGYSVEVYGAASEDVPTDILDRRWKNLGSNKAALSEQTFDVAGKTDDKVNRVVLWFLAGKEAEDPRVAISNVSVRGVK